MGKYIYVYVCDLHVDALDVILRTSTSFRLKHTNNATVDDKWTPKILLCLSPQCRDYKHKSLHHEFWISNSMFLVLTRQVPYWLSYPPCQPCSSYMSISKRKGFLKHWVSLYINKTQNHWSPHLLRRNSLFAVSKKRTNNWHVGE